MRTGWVETGACKFIGDVLVLWLSGGFTDIRYKLFRFSVVDCLSTKVSVRPGTSYFGLVHAVYMSSTAEMLDL